MMLKPSRPNVRGQQFQSRQEIKDLTLEAKNLYIAFNIFELEMSRLTKIDQFQDLMNELTTFNGELEDWKKNKHKISNIVLTYHLYENLFSRLRYISNFSRSEGDAIGAVSQATKWFQAEKPKLRNQVKQVKASIKTSNFDQKEVNNIESLVQTSALKREMQPYEMMSRTAHPGFFPPKQQLRQYKRKQFLPYGDTEPVEQPLKVKKSTSASLLHRSNLSKYRTSVTTMMGTTSTSNFKQTRQSFKNIAQFKLEGGKEEENVQKEKEEEEKKQMQAINEEQIDELEREKKVNQDQVMQQNLAQEQNEEDEPDEDQIYDEGPEKEAKLYIRDHNKFEIELAEEQAKQAQHSSMRRVMKVNEDKIRSKMEELDLKRNMMGWGKIKGKDNREEARKLEALMHCNKYKEIAFERKPNSHVMNPEDKKIFSSTTGFKDYRSAKEPVVVPMLHRSKSSNPASIETEVEKLKIRQALQTYGKYINKHITTPEPAPVVDLEKVEKGDEDKSESTDYRSMSLTSFAHRGKKKNFSNILSSMNPSAYNEHVENDLMRIKTTLSGKSLPVDKGTIYKAMSIVPKQDTLISNGMYTAGRDLLSNPFFPKNLGKKKKKGKK